MSDPNQMEGAIFAAALHLPAERRASYLRKICGADAELRRRLETRLEDQTFLENDTADSEFDPEATVTAVGVLRREEMLGETIGRYKLAEKLGEGGFGTVYVAEQEEPVKRRVAFKITKLGMDTKEVVARFKIERQALATMDHPSIAKVLDAGATSGGRPYFVMELVKGIKITEYCDQNKLSTHKRLVLFQRSPVDELHGTILPHQFARTVSLSRTTEATCKSCVLKMDVSGRKAGVCEKA
jgi:hypothetical protein